jgi:hypothetical protein
MSLERLEPMNPDVIKLVKSKYQKDGFKYATFTMPKESQKYNSYTAILVGVKIDDITKKITEVSLAVGNGKTLDDAQLDACENYLEEI